MRTRPPDLFSRPHADIHGQKGPRRPGQLPPTPTPGRMFSHIGAAERRGIRSVHPMVFLGACFVLALAVVGIEAAIAEARRVDAVQVVFMEDEAAAAAAQIEADGGLLPLPPDAPPAPDAPPPTTDDAPAPAG